MRSKITHDEARRLIVKFMDGDTDSNEERMLYRYFSGKNVSDDLIEYKEMMLWYAKKMKPSSTQSILANFNRKAFGVAASFTILLSIGFVSYQYVSKPDTDDIEYACYEGSYIIRDGKIITDITLILPEIKAAEQKVSQRVAHLQSGISAQRRAVELISKKYASDPELRDRILEISGLKEELDDNN